MWDIGHGCVLGAKSGHRTAVASTARLACFERREGGHVHGRDYNLPILLEVPFLVLPFLCFGG